MSEYDGTLHVADYWRGYLIKVFVSADNLDKIWYSICDVNTVLYFSSAEKIYFDNTVDGICEAVIHAKNIIDEKNGKL